MSGEGCRCQSWGCRRLEENRGKTLPLTVSTTYTLMDRCCRFEAILTSRRSVVKPGTRFERTLHRDLGQSRHSDDCGSYLRGGRLA